MQTDGFLVRCVAEWLLVLVREVLATAMLDTTGVAGEGVEVEMVVLGSVEHTAEDGGKK